MSTRSQGRHFDRPRARVRAGLVICGLALAAMVVPNEAFAQCQSYYNAARQAFSYYRNDRDPYQLQAARNYKNAYNACRSKGDYEYVPGPSSSSSNWNARIGLMNQLMGILSDWSERGNTGIDEIVANAKERKKDLQRQEREIQEAERKLIEDLARQKAARDRAKKAIQLKKKLAYRRNVAFEGCDPTEDEFCGEDDRDGYFPFGRDNPEDEPFFQVASRWHDDNRWAERCRQVNPGDDPFDVSVACEMANKWETQRIHALADAKSVITFDKEAEAKKQAARTAKSPSYNTIPEEDESPESDTGEWTEDQKKDFVEFVRERMDCSGAAPEDRSGYDDQIEIVKDTLVGVAGGPTDVLSAVLSDWFRIRKGADFNAVPDIGFTFVGLVEIFGADDVRCRLRKSWVASVIGENE